MKTLHLSIIASISVLAFSVSAAYAEQPLLDFYNNSQLVLVGKVISLSQVPTTTSNPSQSPNQTRYDIEIEQYYKNPQAAKLITVYGYAKGIYFGQDPTFNVGDRVFLYINQENGYYQIQPHSFALNNDCDARPMIPMPTLPFEPPPISTPADGRVFDFQSASGTRNDTFGLGDKIHINFVAENYLPVIKYAILNFTIKTENNTKPVFNDTKQITIPACYSKVPLSWDFVPKSSGTYFVNVNMSSSVNLGIQTVLFTEPSLGSSFDVRENASGISLAKAPNLPSPLTQFKSGISAQNVKCNDNLVHIIRAEDLSPACVKQESVDKLVNKGWSLPVENPSGKVQHEIFPVINSNDSGIEKIGNQTFHFTTINDTMTTYRGEGVQEIFHNAVFTFLPRPPSIGIAPCGNTNFGSEIKFPDGTYEPLNVQIPGIPCIENYTETELTNHTHPQAGIQDYYGKIRLLVSEDNQTSSSLKLSLSADSIYANPAQSVGVDISLNNTSSMPLILTKADSWSRNDMTLGPCSSLPFGITILKGYYSEQNMTGVRSLILYQNIPCPGPQLIKSYTFQPLSTKATQECDTLFSCTGLVDMKTHLEISGFIDNNGQHQPFNVGTYTIIAGDEWGDVTIQHFTEAYAVAYNTPSSLNGS